MRQVWTMKIVQIVTVHIAGMVDHMRGVVHKITPNGDYITTFGRWTTCVKRGPWKHCKAVTTYLHRYGGLHV